MEYLGLFIVLGILCFLFYLAIKNEEKRQQAEIARQKAQTELLETIVAFIEHKHIRICWDALRGAADDDQEVTDDGR